MGMQLKLPTFKGNSAEDDLQATQSAKRETLKDIRAILDRHARAQGVYWLHVNQAMDSIDDAVSDMFFEVEDRLKREIEDPNAS
jgi:hypothetical protein